MNDFTSMRAMILAAGFGTRLFPLTIDRAKPAIPFLNRPLVGYVAEYLAGFGCREVGVNLHHESDSMRRALGDGTRFGVNLTYVEEPEILGTGGALANARAFLDGNTFIVINGKIITDIDLHAALATHRRASALATLILRRNHARERFSVVHTTADNLISGFGGMPSRASDNGDRDGSGQSRESLNERSDRAHGVMNDAPLMFTGIQILEPEIFAYIPPHGFSHTTTDVYPHAIAQGERVVAYIAEGMWHELSTIERYMDISIALMRHENLAFVGGEDCFIGEGAQVTGTVMWDRVSIGEGAHLDECVLGDGVHVPAGGAYSRAAIMRAGLVRGVERPPKALAGEFDGDNFVVPLPR